jgi:hypothetical protein
MPRHDHAAPMLRCAVALRSRFQNGMVVAWHGHGMACENQTRPHCVNQMEKTQSEPLVARHGRGAEWEQHGMYELALNCQSSVYLFVHTHIVKGCTVQRLK